ncbi:MAG TPA: hypothetical protein VGC10_09910 [Sphingomonas sp.]
MIGLLALLAGATATPFAPPIDRPLRYETVDRRAARGAAPEQRFTLVQEARFARDGAGAYLLTIRALSAHADAPARVAAMFDAAMRPSIGGAITIRVSAAGEPGAMIDADAVWARLLDTLRVLTAAAMTDPPERRAMIDQIAAAITATPPAEREARLRGGADAILGIMLPPLRAGESTPLTQSLASPGGPVMASGTVRREADGDQTRRYRIVTDGDAAPDHATRLHLHSDETVTLSASSGLMLDDTHRIVVALAGANAAPVIASDTMIRLLPGSW